jgi:hypothetical protein
LEVGVVFVELAFLFLGGADGPRARGGRSAAWVVLRKFIEFFTSSSFDRLDFDFRFARGLWTVRERPSDSPREDFPCGQSVVQSRTVRFFRVRLCWFGVLFRTVCVWWPDGPRPLRGRSAGPTQSVRPGFCSLELLLRFLFVCFCFLSLGFLVVPLRLFEPCLGSCLCVCVRGFTIGVLAEFNQREQFLSAPIHSPSLWSPEWSFNHALMVRLLTMYFS